MARISSYPKDTTIQDNDAWVGTASPNRQTKNFLASDVAKYLNIKGKISISAQMVYEFKSDPNEAGTGDFYGVSDNTDFSTITSLNISATDKGNQNVVNFITYLVDSDILISEQKNISSFGHYKITAYTDNGDGFYTLTLSYLGGGGSVGNKKFYDIANFSIAKLGDITAVNAGTYLNGGGSSGDVTLNHDLTSRTNTTSSVTPGYGGTFTAIDSVVTNTTGHITTVNTKTVTIPDSGVDGNGTTNYVAKWLDADTIQNSIIFDNGTNVGIGTSSPNYTLELQVSQPDENPVVYSQFGGSNGVTGNSFLQIGGARGSTASERYSYLQTLDGAGGFRILSLNPSGGNVGIGTTSPTKKLDIVSNGSGSQIQITSPTPGIKLIDSNLTTRYAEIKAENGNVNIDIDPGQAEGVSYFSIDIDNSEKFRINKDGYVGIGTTSPSEKLEVSGNIWSGTIKQNTSTILQRVNSAWTNNVTTDILYNGWTSSTSDYVLLRSAGNIFSQGAFVVAKNGAYFGQHASTGAITDSSSTPLSTTWAKIAATSYFSGNVGIGTTSPSQKLHVDGNLRVTGAYYDSNNTPGTSGQVLSSTVTGTDWVSLSEIQGVDGTGTANYIAKWSDTDTITDSIILEQNSGIGIGGSVQSGFKLDIAGKSVTRGSIYLSGNIEYFGSNDLNIRTGSTNAIKLSTNSSEHMRITSLGNVGIGTTSPAFKTTIYSSGTTDSFPLVVGQGNAPNEFVGIGLSGFIASNGAVKAAMVLDRNGIYGVGDIHFLNNTTQDNTNATLSDSRLVIKKSGNVGIGTTDPNSIFEIRKDVNNGEGAELRVINNGTAVGTGQTSTITIGRNFEERNIKIKSVSSENYGIKPELVITQNQNATGSSHTEVLRINSSGNVGIGTTSPSQKLTVAGNITQTSNAYYIATRKIVGRDANGLTLTDDSGANGISIKDGGLVQLINYGSGTNTGTVTQRLGVDSSGIIREIPIGSGAVDGSGTANYITKWSDADTITDSVIYDDGTNVGIGTTSPTHKLDVRGGDVHFENTSSSNTFLDVKGSSANAYIRAYSDSNSVWLYQGGSSSYLQAQSGSTLRLGSGTANVVITDTSGEVMRTSSGNVGIGTTSPSQKLHVYGKIKLEEANGGTVLSGNYGYFKVSPTNNYGVLVENSLDAAKYFSFGVPGDYGQIRYKENTSSAISVSATGVGIGTTSPSEKLDVAGSILISNTDNDKYFGSNVNLILNADADGNSGATARNIIFQNRGSEKMRIDSTGNVGIGTTSPLEKLDVNGNINIRTTSSGVRGIKRDNDGYNLQLVGGSSLTGGSYIEVNGGSRGGVGNAVNGEINFVSGGSYQSSQSAVVGNYNFKTQWNGGSATLMHIDSSSGNVGIGTSSPARKLNVNGNVGINNQLLLDSANYNEHLAIRRGVYGYDTIVTGTRIDYSPTASTDTFKFLADLQTTGQLNVTGNSIINGNVGIGTTSINNFGFLETVLNIVAGNSSSTTLRQAGIVISGSSDADDADDFGYLSFTNYQSATSNGRVAEIRALKNGTNVDTGEFAFYTSSGSGPAERMRINRTGNVGIGTANPSDNLEIGTNGNVDTAFRMYSDQSGKYFRISSGGNFTQLRTTNGQNLFLDSGGTSGYITFAAGDSERMRITSGGNVGIGTTSPITKLHVVGNGYINSGSLFIDSGQRLKWGNSNQWIEGTNDTSLEFSGGGGGTQMILTSAGNVGIATTNPQSQLQINGGDGLTVTANDTAYSAGYFGRIQSDYGTNALRLVSRAGDVFRATNYGQDVAILTGGLNAGTSERMRITSSGNVGIGTTSPSYPLDVSGDIRSTSYVRADDAFVGDTIISTGNQDFAINKTTAYSILLNTNGSERMRVDSSGRVNIGTTTHSTVGGTAKMTINVGSSISSPISIVNGTTDGMYIRRYSTGGSYQIQTTLSAGNSGNLSLQSYGGNVGVGILSPNVKFQVTKGSSGFSGTYNSRTSAVFENSSSIGSCISIMSKNTGFSGIFFGDENSETVGQFKYDHTDDSFRFLNNGGVERMRITSSGNVGIGTTSPLYKLDVSGGARTGGVITYSKSAGSLDTTGYAVAGLITGSNGSSAGFTFTCFGHTGKYQKIVYSCYNGNGTWYAKKVIDEGTNDFDIEASADAATITFTFKSTSGSKAYTPRVTVEATGHSINSTYA